MARTLNDMLGRSLRDDPGRPLVTFYDDASGERVELSVTTFDNWVSKIANLFADEIGVDPGDGFAVDLPPHWLAPIVVLGGWAAGLVLTEPEDAGVRVVGPGARERPGSASAAPTVACSLRPLGGRFLEPLPAGWLDFAVEVPPQPDAILLPQAVATSDPAVATAAMTATHAELQEAGDQQSVALGLRTGGRLATDLNPADPAVLVTALAAPIAASAAVVLVVNATPKRRTAIAEQERVTCQVWSD